MSCIQLHYGASDDNKKQIKLNLPTTYKSEFLPLQLPYLPNLKNLIFQSSIIDVINNRENCKNTC